jgi:hypothetical protein
MNDMKAWEICDADVIAGPHLETTLTWYCEEMGVPRPEPEDIEELELTKSVTFTHDEDGPLAEPFTQTIAEMIEQQIRIGNNKTSTLFLWSSEW